MLGTHSHFLLPLKRTQETTNRMHTVGANGIRLGRCERGAHRTTRSERRRLCLGETNAALLLTFVITESQVPPGLKR